MLFNLAEMAFFSDYLMFSGGLAAFLGKAHVCFRGFPFQWIWEVGSYGCMLSTGASSYAPNGSATIVGDIPGESDPPGCGVYDLSTSRKPRVSHEKSTYPP